MNSKPEEQTFDVIIIGSGLKECILFGFLAGTTINNETTKVALISDNETFNCENIGYSYYELQRTRPKDDDPFKQMKEEKNIRAFEADSEWHIDLIPKFFLIKEKMKTYMKNFLQLEDISFKQIDGSYILKVEDSLFTKSKNVLWKVPTSSSEFTSVSTQHLNKFIKDSMSIDTTKPSEENKFMNDSFDVNMKAYKMDKFTADIIGRGMCFYRNDNFLHSENSQDIIEKIQLYFKACEDSVTNTKRNPFTYPIEGLSTIAEAFSMMGAFNDGKIIVSSRVAGIAFDSEQKFKHITLTDSSIINGKYLIIQPDIAAKLGLEGKLKNTNRIIYKAVYILNKPLPKCKNTNNCVIIVPNKDNDIYITYLSHTHQICKSGYYVAIISAIMDKDANPEEEIKQATEIISNAIDKFTFKMPYYERVKEDENSLKKHNNIFVCNSLDSSPYFINDLEDIEDIYYQITKKKLCDLYEDIDKNSKK